MNTISIVNPDWFSTASEQDRILFYRVCEFEELFLDMTFKSDDLVKKAIMCKSFIAENDKWISDTVPIPDELECFDYCWFDYKVKSFGNDNEGSFNCKTQTLSVDENSLNCNSTILHEMIHLHEYVVNEQPLFFHDTLFWCLYKSLRERIPNLDKLIDDHGHIFNETNLLNKGGLHDTLFLLKSYDLDLKMGYKLGTVFGYGYDLTKE